MSTNVLPGVIYFYSICNYFSFFIKILLLFLLLSQYCDLFVPEIEQILATTTPADVCDERYGWYPQTVEDECRRILNTYINDSFSSKKMTKIAIRFH